MVYLEQKFIKNHQIVSHQAQKKIYIYKKNYMKRHIYFCTILFSVFISLQCTAQYDAANYCYVQDSKHDLSDAVPAGPIADLSLLGGIPCNANTFYSLTAGGTIEELEINGNTITSNGAIAPATGYYSLAYCANLNGGTYSPTFYSHLGSTYGLDYYNGSSWTSTGSLPLETPGGICGFGNKLYLIYSDSIVEYNGTSFNKIYDPGGQVLTIADAAVDAQGNIWCTLGNTFSNTTSIIAISPAGQIVKQFPFVLNTINGYGCFLLNGKFYIGFGSFNPIYTDQVLPISFTSTSAVTGTPMALSSAQYVRDFASCNPGSPISVSEYESESHLPVYPNPAGKFLFLPDHFSNLGVCRVFRPDGMLVADGIRVDGNSSIKVEGLSRGLYFLEARKGETVYRAEFIKQ